MNCAIDGPRFYRYQFQHVYRPNETWYLPESLHRELHSMGRISVSTRLQATGTGSKPAPQRTQPAQPHRSPTAIPRHHLAIDQQRRTRGEALDFRQVIGAEAVGLGR